MWEELGFFWEEFGLWLVPNFPTYNNLEFCLSFFARFNIQLEKGINYKQLIWLKLRCLILSSVEQNLKKKVENFVILYG